jgi:arrestin-related trafficking adapter 9
MITATLTRPNRTSIMNPVMTCETTVKYQEVVDISNIAVPQQREVELTGHSQQSRRRRSIRLRPPDSATEIASNSGGVFNTQDSPRDSIHSSPSDQSPSVVTRNSSKGKTSMLPFVSYLNHPPRNQGIKCTVSVGKGGYLRGEMIYVKVQIEHHKAVKSLHGVIVTFYRLGRIDTDPPLQLINGEAHSRRIFPIKGPSWLPSTTGCHLFRKDLNQTFASIIINHGTLAQTIKASLRVPVNSFPTITSVPGAMISFKYFVEVIVDLPGKLTGLHKFLPTPEYNSAQGLLGLSTPGAQTGLVIASIQRKSNGKRMCMSRILK